MSSQLDLLTQINLDDLVDSFGWSDRSWLSRLLRGIFARPARTFAGDMIEFDNIVASHGLTEASREMLKRYIRAMHVFGRENLPGSGPVLFLSNHPGMADTLAIFSAINHPDLKIIALNRPFLNALPNTSKQLFFLKDDSASRISLMRQVSAYLRAGGAILTFPAGKIEPDPDVYPGALESLDNWNDSVGVFVRMAPETAVVPVLVRGVIWDRTAHFPLLALAKKTVEEREKLAATLQLLAHVQFRKRPVTVTVQFGNPITVEKLGSTNSQVIHQAVLIEMRRLIQNPPLVGNE